MKDWKKILVSGKTPILQVLRIIDNSSMQIVLVADEQHRLLGTVTDGDIRRGILKGVSLESPVKKVMNSHSITARLNDSREDILALMKMKAIRQIPVLDENGVISGIQIMEDLIQLGRRNNVVVLMAGGMGTRLRPLTDECPKPLLKVGNKPILETILENFIDYGLHRFFLSVNFKADMLEKYFGNGSRKGITINYLYEDKPMGTAGPLGLLPDRPTKPFLVMNSDLLTKVNFQQLLDYHQEHGADATMCVREYTFQIPYGVTTLDKHRLLDIEEKPVHRYFVSAGIYVLEPKVLDLVPHDSYFDMPNLFKQLIKRGHEVVTFPIREYWIDIGRRNDLERARDDYSEIFK